MFLIIFKKKLTNEETKKSIHVPPKNLRNSNIFLHIKKGV